MRKCNYTIILLLLCWVTTAQAQDYKKKKMMRSSQKNFGRSYLDQADEIQPNDPAKAVSYVQKALEVAVKQKDDQLEGDAYALLGDINREQKQYDVAIDHYKKAITAYKRINSSNSIYKAQKSLADSYMNNGDYPEALNLYQQLLTKAKKQGLNNDVIAFYRARANIYELRGDYDQALKELDQAEALIPTTKSSSEQGEDIAIKLQRGGIYEAQSKNEEAKALYEESEELSQSKQDRSALLNSNSRISSLLKKEGKLEEAVQKRKEGLKYFNQSDNYEPSDSGSQEIESEISEDLAMEENRARLDIGINYVELDSSEQAISYLNEAIADLDAPQAIQEKKEAFRYLSEAYYASGNYDSALISYRNYVALVDSTYRMKEADILASLDLNKELSRRLQRINVLEKDREIQEKTIALLEKQRLAEEERNSRLTTMVYALIGGLILLLVLLYFMNKSSKERRITNQLLALKSLRTQMNPHFIFNALNSVNNFISQSDERSANKYLSDFSRLMRLVLEQSEYDFIPLASELEILKLYVALEHSRFHEKFDYEWEIDPDLELDRYEIPPMVVQPYIENAVWHGLRYLDRKGSLRLILKEAEEGLLISIIDDGIGRKRSQEVKTKNQKSNRSTAMRNIEERLRIINQMHQSNISVRVADLDANHGTKVQIHIPPKSE